MPPPNIILTDKTLNDVPPVIERDKDIIVPARGWQTKVPPELTREMAVLRRRYDSKIRDALKNAETSQRFLTDPVGVLDELKVPLSEGLRARLAGPNGLDAMSAPARLHLPGNAVVSPDVNVRIQDQPASSPQAPATGQVVRLWNPFGNLFKTTGVLNHGYPVVYEISKSCIHDLLGQWFDRGVLADILDHLSEQVTDPVLQVPIKLAELASQAFDLDLDLGMPAGLTSSCPDILTLTLRVPHPDPNAPPADGAVAVSAFLRIAASLVVDHSDPSKEEFYLDLTHRLADAEAKITVANLPIVGTQTVDLSTPFAAYLQQNCPQIKVFFDVPVDRSGKAAMMPTQVDVRIIDDPMSPDCDAIALLLSFADLGPGDRTAFTQSFLCGGSGLSVDFNWLRAKLLPELQTALGLPTPIDPATGLWFGLAPIAGGDGAVLTFFALGVLSGSRDITVLVRVARSGDCYSATASMGATLSLYVDQGEFVFKPPQFTTPTVNVDIPWYCYLLSILVGGALGGIIAADVGTMVGAIVAPILLHSIQGVAEGVVESVVETVNSSIQSQVAGLQQIDLGSLKTVLQFASIDDLLVLHDVAVGDSLPALAEATVFVPNGGYLDLVTGKIAPISGNAGHLAWAGTGAGRVLLSVGQTALSLVGNLDPGDVTRYQIYHCSFSTGQRIALAQLASWDGQQYRPNGLVYAARTNDGHYAKINVMDVADDGVWLHYKTYPHEVGEKVVVPTVELHGGFTAKQIHTIGTDPKPQFQSLAGKGLGKWGAWFDANAHWYDEGTFTPNWIGFKNPMALSWKVQGQSLAGKEGTVTVQGVPLQYQTYGGQLLLMVDPIVIIDVEIEVGMRDDDGHQASATLTARTVEGGIGRRIGPTMSHGITPSLNDYLVAYKKHVGPWTEVDPEAIASQGYRTDRVVPRQIRPVVG